MQKTRANTQAEPDNTEQRFFSRRNQREVLFLECKNAQKISLFLALSRKKH